MYNATWATLPKLVEQGRGHVINVSSISGHIPLPGGSAYAATKYAMTGFSDSLFLEVRESGVKVSVVSCGSVEPTDAETWKVTPQEVGRVVNEILDTRGQNCVSRVEIRSLFRPRK